jgi:hypothetical protein
MSRPNLSFQQWHSLSRDEQAKYYEKARQERQKHLQMYPHWNARDNYRYGLKKKKRKRDKTDDPGTTAISRSGLTLFLFIFSLVARLDSRGAVKVLRDGQGAEADAHGEVPGLVSQGQLRQAQKEKEEKG